MNDKATLTRDSALARRIAGLSPRERALLEARLGNAPPKAEATISRAARDTAVPLSAAQQGLWLLDQLSGPNAVYNMARAYRVCGALNVPALWGALVELLARHESLRTGFEPQEGSARQCVLGADQAAAALRLHVQALAPGGADDALQAWLHAQVSEPFELTRAPLLRARLLRCHEHEHVLLLVVHHIVADGWSMDILWRELSALYSGACAGREAALPALPIQFADYALWQQQRLRGEPAQRELAYWREQLAGLEPLQLPTDRPRTPHPDHRGALVRLRIEPTLRAALEALARQENVTPFMLLLAAWQVLLMRYSGQHDVAVGSPVAGRQRTELEGLIGYFVNMLVLRGDLSGNPGFTALLRRVRETCLQAYAHQELPFERLVAELSPQRELGRNPLFQVSFALNNLPAPGSDPHEAFGGREQALRMQRLPMPGNSAKFDLSLTLAEHDAGLRGALEYSTQLFDAGTVERMARHYRQLLRSIVAQPETPIAQLALLDQAERTQLLFGWNDTAREFPRELALPQLFEAQVRRTPQACALVMPELAPLSYAELDARANRLARQLRALGVGPEVRVGLCLPRRPAMVVAMLAILKAGGAYVPLDPQYPRERLAFMLADAAVAVVLTEPSLRATLPHTDASVLCLDDDARPDIAGFDCLLDSPLHALAQPHHLAYVIYTSGSTGTPKGVAIPQAAVSRLVINTDYVQLGADDVIAQASSSSFDAATFEVWGALLNGARLLIVPKETLLSSTELRRCITEHGINTLFLTTALFNEHAAHSPDIFRSLDQLLFGGEAVDPGAVRRVLEAGPPGRLLHVYGPTETTTFATWHEVPRDAVAEKRPIPIGRPIANTRCHVLDAHRQPVPVGAVGELHIGGPGLACGYVARPELTAERFIPDPFRPGERLYRSGDLVRYREDGAIEYIARLDQQVKIRGFRIELGEIEAALAGEPGVAQCAVVVREEPPGGKRLVAYAVPAEGATLPPAREICRRIAERLPQFMVPSAIVTLDALPLTANGKLDRNALPAPELSSETDRGDATVDASIDEVERKLQAIWEQVLAIRPIGVNDSFFDLGGHSLLAIGLLDAVARRFRTTLRLATLFEGPTIRSQAALLRRTDSSAPISCAVAVQPRGVRAPLFFVSGYGGAILPFHTLARELGDEQPLYVLDINSLGEIDLGTITIASIAGQMIADMRREQPRGPYHLAGFSLGGKIVYEMAQQLHRASETVSLLALLDCAAPGFHRQQAFPVRVVQHIRHALKHEPGEALSYLIERVRRLKKYFGFAERQDLSVFKQKVVVDRSAALVQAIEARAQPIHGAWAAYRPTFYPGRMTLVRAEVREVRLGVVDDDPQMGWCPLIGGGVDLASLHCGHTEMLDAPHAPALATLLLARLRAPSAGGG